MPGTEFAHQDGKLDASLLILNRIGKLDRKADAMNSNQSLAFLISAIDSINNLDNLLD